MHSVFAVMFLFAVWFTLSGQKGIFLVFIGFLSSVLIFFGFYRYLNQPNFRTNFNIKFFLFYLPWVFWQVLLSCVFVAKKVYKLKIDIQDTESNIVTLKVKKGSNFITAVLANSITLTPGTATLLLEDDKLYIHCLTKDVKDGIFDIKNYIAKKLE